MEHRFPLCASRHIEGEPVSARTIRKEPSVIYYWEFRNGQWRRLETAPFPGLENVRPPGGLTDEALPDFLLQQGYLYTITVPGIVSTLNTAQAYEAVGTRDDLDYRFIVGGIAHAEAVDYIFLPQSPDWIQFLRLMHT